MQARRDHLTSTITSEYASMPKRKAQPSGLNKGGGNFMSGAKKSKPSKEKGKENVSIWVISVKL